MNKILIFLLVIASSPLAWGQRSRLVSELDKELSIETVAVAPLVDNVSGIYAGALSPQLAAIVADDRQWDLKSWPEMTPSSPEEFENSPQLVVEIMERSGADALVMGRISRGPNGVNIKLNLFVGKEGLLFAQENLSNFQGFETAEVGEQIRKLFLSMKTKLPYGGTVLSRRGQMVTINVGAKQGIKENSNISVVQILKINRHPKFNFITQTDKEILGRIRVQKAEESLSFGLIELERSENLIQAGAKLMPVTFVDYPVVPEIKTPEGSEYIYGESPKEWTPKSTPTFGKASILGGLGTYGVNNTLSSVGAVSGSQSVTPSIHILGEMWLTTNWYTQFELRQFVYQLGNDYPSSSPDSLSGSTSQTGLLAGYNFLLSEDFFGPKFYIAGGYGRVSSTIDTSSPLAFTSVTLSGLKFVVGGEFNLEEQSPYMLGAKLNYFLLPSLTENPLTSGASNNASITSFMAYMVYKSTPTLNYRGELLYDTQSVSFSGAGTRGADSATSLSHTSTTISFGVEVLF